MVQSRFTLHVPGALAGEIKSIFSVNNNYLKIDIYWTFFCWYVNGFPSLSSSNFCSYNIGRSTYKPSLVSWSLDSFNYNNYFRLNIDILRTHQEVASDSFCFLINSSWLLAFILSVFSLFFSGLNLYCWKGIHFS